MTTSEAKPKRKPAAKTVAARSAAAKPAGKYVEGVGRRKTAVARVRLVREKGDQTVNGKALGEYFPVARLQAMLLAPLSQLGMVSELSVSAHVKGGGVKAQAEAVRHGIARALVLMDGELKKKLRMLGYLTRDSRMVERKKYGLKKARRAPQWSKR